MSKQAYSSIKGTLFNQKVFIFFSLLHKSICCGYPLEVPQLGTSNEYPSFCGEIKKKISPYHISSQIWFIQISEAVLTGYI